MYATDFEYANKRLSDFDCITCYLDEASGTSEVDIGCDITFNTIKNNHSSIQYKTSTSYDNVYTTTFKIMKNPCKKSQDDIYMTYEEVRSLTRWLNRREYKKFKVLSDNMSEDIHYYGSFNVKEQTIGDKIIGLVLTFTSNTPYGFAEEIDLEYDIEFANEHIYLSGDSDEFGIIYPTISIEFKEDCDEFTIANITTDSVLKLKNCSADEIITIDGEHKIIFTNKSEHKQTLYNDFNYEYLDIIVKDDDLSENLYEVSAPCRITIKYSPIRKVGVC